jgi:hypothetical protein
VTTSIVQELYHSSNGDRWALAKDSSGRLLVVHHPNQSSGGRCSEISLDVFLSRAGHGPEQQALLRALMSSDLGDNTNNMHQKLLAETTELLSRALGKAVARCWSSLPQDIQHDLFEAAVISEGENIRHQLAVYLHGEHHRTLDALQARSMPMPDSLGG